jgi:hypothetical protein
VAIDRLDELENTLISHGGVRDQLEQLHRMARIVIDDAAPAPETSERTMDEVADDIGSLVGSCINTLSGAETSAGAVAQLEAMVATRVSRPEAIALQRRARRGAADSRLPLGQPSGLGADLSHAGSIPHHGCGVRLSRCGSPLRSCVSKNRR